MNAGQGDHPTRPAFALLYVLPGRAEVGRKTPNTGADAGAPAEEPAAEPDRDAVPTR
ncbi:hypothetical protein [Streptomyces sp. CT34]|uniref:hypothetical protein n=1 Tax=Streptomyces sp. CT34 TaxID=1553907 RepID=UPI0012FEA902|nr:hypothetical protein [Streptomyces sp. CT34]